MPTLLHRIRPAPLAKARPQRFATDWLGIWALSQGVIAIGLAAFIYITDGDPVAASFVLIAVAAIIGVALRDAARADQAD
jgi:hypothetical protein